MNLSKLKLLIANDNLEEVFKKLKELITTNDYINEIILLERQFTDLKKKNRTGTVSSDSVNTNKNKLCSALLELIDKLESKVEFDSYRDLSDEAKTLLLEASHDSGGLIRTHLSNDGWSLQTDNKILFERGTARDRVMWEEALSKLSKLNLLRQLENNPMFYRITKKGFETIDIETGGKV